jgi:rhodanese-related sulfurtransferase
MGEITVEELKDKMDRKEDFMFIDVREQYEYDEFNLGAKLIPLGEFMDNIPNLESHRDEEIIIHCRSGKRSGMATEVLTSAGFSNVKNVVGGVLRWQEVYPG